MGEVYEAHDARLGRDVAIKVLPERFSKSAERLRRFEQEARATGALNHPNILAIYDVGTHEGSPYLVTELLEGETLRSALKDGALAPRRAIDYAAQIANGLTAAHGKGFVHRDLKPENLFIVKDGRVKILDFGLAKLTQAAEDVRSDLPTLVESETGAVLGTAGYMSPEQVRGQTVDHRSDIFSLGATLYEMLSGTRAFRRDSSVETMNAILKEEPPELESKVATIQPALERIVRRCLEKQLERRFQSVSDLGFALETISGSAIGASATAQGDGRAVAQRAGPYSWKAILTAIAVTFIVSFAAFLAWNKWSPPQNTLATEWQGERLGGSTVAFGPRIRPDGKMLAFQALIDGLTQVGVMTPESGDWSIQTMDRSRGLVQDFSWSSDGNRIFFDRFFELPRGIFSVPALGRGEERLVLEDAMSPIALPDGSLVVTKVNAGAKQLYRFWPETQRLEALPALPSQRVLAPAVRPIPGGREEVFFGKPAASDASAEHLYALDLTSGRTRPLAPTVIFPPTGNFPLAVTRDGTWVLFDLPAGDLHRIVAAPVDGSIGLRPIAMLTSDLSSLDIDESGNLYVDQVDRPAEMLRYAPAEGRLERFRLAENQGQVLPLPDGRLVIGTGGAGGGRLMVMTAGGDAKPLIQTRDETAYPATMLGTDRLAFVQGKGTARTVAIATLDGRVARKLAHVPGDINALAGAPDGKTLYYSKENEVWRITEDDGEPQKLHRGLGVAVDPSGQSLVIFVTEQDTTRLLRLPLDGGPEVPIPIKSDLRLVYELGPNAIAADGRIAVRVASKESWFWPAAILDPRTGELKVLDPPGFDADMASPGWDRDGRLVTTAIAMRSSLWRFRPLKR